MKFIPFFKYLHEYKSQIGLRIYIAISLVIISAFLEGIGIAMLLPLLDSANIANGLTNANSNESLAISFVRDFFRHLGYEYSFTTVLVLIASIITIKGITLLSVEYYIAKLKTDFSVKIRLRLINAFSAMSYGFSLSKEKGFFLNLINEQVLKSTLSLHTFIGAYAQGFNTIVYIGLAISLEPFFGLMAIFFGFIFLFLYRKLNHFVRESSIMSVKKSHELMSRLSRFISAFKYLLVSSNNYPLSQEFKKPINEIGDIDRKLALLSGFTQSSREPIIMLTLIFILFIQVNILGNDIASILVAILLFHRAIGAVLGFQGNWQSTMQTYGSLHYILKSLDEIEMEESGNRKLQNNNDGCNLEIKKVSFSFPKGEEIFKDFSLRIESNTTCAIIGPSGSGKTTFVDIVTGILPASSGNILIDSINLKELNYQSFRQRIGYVGQDSDIFDGSIIENVIMNFDPKKPKQLSVRAKKILDDVGLGSFIETLPSGVETKIGEKGQKLSGGQKQRLCIARELYRSPRLLILDEPTSALDTHSEFKMGELLKDICGKTTILLITHRYKTALLSDNVLIIKNGEKEFFGKTKELLKSESDFNKLVKNR